MPLKHIQNRLKSLLTQIKAAATFVVSCFHKEEKIVSDPLDELIKSVVEVLKNLDPSLLKFSADINTFTLALQDPSVPLSDLKEKLIILPQDDQAILNTFINKLGPKIVSGDPSECTTE